MPKRLVLFDYATNTHLSLSVGYIANRQTPQKALLAVGGLLNGIFGSNEDRHIATWSSVKVVDKTTEEDERGVITIREKERFSNELTLVFATGRVATLK